MKAALLDATAPIEKAPLRVTDRDRPTAGIGELVIEVASCGVCRSNLHMIEGDWPGVPSQFPIIPGHEVVGTVAEVGTGSDGFSVGDRVGVQPLWSTCGTCEYCMSGREQLCQSKEITGETVDGGYAQFMLSKAAHTYHLPDALDFADAAPLFCPGITAYGAVVKADLSPAKRAAVFGVGGVGHMAIQYAALYGADVVAVSRGREHLEVARELGASWTVDSTDGDAGSVIAAKGGVDASFVFAPSDAVFQQAMEATKPGGIIVVGVNVNVGPLPFATEKHVVGSLLGSRRQMQEVLEIAAAGKIRAICEPYPLDEANEVLARLKNGQIRARAVVMP